MWLLRYSDSTAGLSLEGTQTASGSFVTSFLFTFTRGRRRMWRRKRSSVAYGSLLLSDIELLLHKMGVRVMHKGSLADELGGDPASYGKFLEWYERNGMHHGDALVDRQYDANCSRDAYDVQLEQY